MSFVIVWKLARVRPVLTAGMWNGQLPCLPWYHTSFSLSRKKEGRSLGLEAQLSSGPRLPGVQGDIQGSGGSLGAVMREHVSRRPEEEGIP